MDGGGFERLLSPGRLGSLELRNRIAMCPMGTNLAEPDGSVGDPQAAWFAARSHGGAGLILVGSASVAYPSGSYGERQVAISSDEYLPGLRRLVDDVHAGGAAIAAQLVHDGSQSMLDIALGQPLLVPSKRRPPDADALSMMLTPAEMAAASAPFTSPTASLRYQVATDDDLSWVVSSFAAAAVRAVEAGFDGIELHAGHGYLLDAFLSPVTNRRDDRWGGDAAGRATLLVAVVSAVRAAVGPTFPVWARINAFEVHRTPGQTLDDALVAMRLAVDAGLDAVHVTTYAEPMVATGITDGHTTHEPGSLLPAASAVRAALGVPVIAMGRLTPETAEAALADGHADVVAFGRPLIADPDLPRKLATGRRHTVRPCAYQYRCIGAIFLGDPVRCAVNPDAGREAEVAAPTGPATGAGAGTRAGVGATGAGAGVAGADQIGVRTGEPERSEAGRSSGLTGTVLAPPSPDDGSGHDDGASTGDPNRSVHDRAERPARRVVVVGAGPAGLECARRLAERGVAVEVWDAGDVAGGMLRTAERIDPDLLGLADWLVGAAVDAGVDLRLGVRADAASLSTAAPDFVVWAAGATWPGLPDVRAWLDGDPTTADADEPAHLVAGRPPAPDRSRSTPPANAPGSPSPVAVRGRGKAAVSTALAAARTGAPTTLDPLGESVLAPELGLPGRFRLVAAAQSAGVLIATGSADDDWQPSQPDPAVLAASWELDLRPGEPTPAPTVDGTVVHVIGDASGTVGLADALRAAADLAADLADRLTA